MTWFNPKESDKAEAAINRRIALANSALDRIPLDQHEEWRRQLRQLTRLEHIRINAKSEAELARMIVT